VRDYDSYEVNYWPSLADIFASLFIIFLIFFAVYYGKVGYMTHAIEKDWDELKDLLTSESDIIDVDMEEKIIKISEKALFEFDEFILTENGQRLAHEMGYKLGSYLNFENRYKNYLFLIEGHTDSKGTHEYNNTLSLNRANALLGAISDVILDYNFLDKDQIGSTFIPVAYGETKPHDGVYVDELRSEENRRVEIRIIPRFNEALEGIIKDNR
jgi:outer membrane protein OmpA-like peptidoglycan-associated protein